jgi:hypothetical protein
VGRFAAATGNGVQGVANLATDYCLTFKKKLLSTVFKILREVKVKVKVNSINNCDFFCSS